MSKKQSQELTPRNKTPRTPEEYERLNVSLAMRLASERLRDGTASAQEILYWLKVGSPETQLQRQLIKAQISLNEAKVDEIKSVKRDADMYENAMKAINRYQPEKEHQTFDGEFEEM